MHSAHGSEPLVMQGPNYMVVRTRNVNIVPKVCIQHLFVLESFASEKKEKETFI